MRRVLPFLGLSGMLAWGVLSPDAFAQDSTEADTEHNTEQPKEAEQPAPVLTPAPPVAA